MPKNKSAEFHVYVMEDLLGELPGITSRAMFGGYGIYQHGTIFAIIADRRLYFRTGDGNRGAFEEQGSKPFTYRSPKGKTNVMSYWEVPVDVLENKDELHRWVAVAVRESKSVRRK